MVDLNMKITDCPHAVGTQEHKIWILWYIKAAGQYNYREHGKKYGAESIGSKLIMGHINWSSTIIEAENDDSDEDLYLEFIKDK